MAEQNGEASMVDKVKDTVEAAKGTVEDALPVRSKASIKKEQKALEKAKKKEAYAKEAQAAPKTKPAKPVKDEQAAPVRDPDAMFKEGWLDEVRKERPEPDVYTRFPPEPNGYLHIGHSKAIAVNFGFARYHGGKCYLRFDDTNPEAEEEKFFTAIEDIIRWLGFKPYRITYSSDNFDKLYKLAEELIERDGAYVCHCTDEQIKDQRGGTDEKNKHPRYGCEHRSRPTEESLAEFRAMKDGKYKPRAAFLRMKQDDFVTGNPQMWDLAAYRIIDQPHHRTGTKWKIYPTYDFTHCLCDSFEHITHSLCTVEFINSRESYEWLCDKVEVYKPMQREYGRLNLTGTIMSKRKIARLVKEGKVLDWDDPRLYTLVALRRRGVPPGAILSFVNELGVTTARSNIQTVRFESSVRKYLEMTVPRLMVITDPIKVIIDNLPEDYEEEVENGFGPKNVDMGSHKMPFTRTVYIERDDFRETASKDFFRLAPGSSVGLLKVTYPITCTSFKKDDTTGLVTEVHATYDKPAEGETFKKPKSYIHWVAESSKHSSPVKVEARVFNSLFKSDNPEAVEPDFMADIREDSLVTFPNALAEVGLTEIQRRAPWPEEAGEANGEVKPGRESVRFQAMRVGYFCVDRETTPEKIILNRIVGLKEDAGKGSA
ncbi:Glutaminyl-tRNA synthetase [Knufia obscura]|uniref:glutamine--tRNA ligase n=2 Tax=Knufia TaxID=430999 RepID=A0AAN8ER57_9EURO|nr:Glutaminyl-tRNA synthetase [Knufia obscura]KAK5950413.1 Glutaminyl-tRNA synthetase [Knufia fluminis]